MKRLASFNKVASSNQTGVARADDDGFPIILNRLEVALWLDHTVRV